MRKHNDANESEVNRIIWAIDAFPESFEMQSRAASVIRAVSSSGATVEPVYVLRSQQSDFSSPTIDDHGKGLCVTAEQNLEKFLASEKIPGLLTPRFLTRGGDSIRQGVTELLKYAQDCDADLLAVSTHARKGVSRFFLGSFAETLILQSPLPVLVSNPKCRELDRIEHIFFPTDFSESSREVFERAIALALEWSAEIILFHQIRLAETSDEKAQVRIATVKEHAAGLVYYANQCGVAARFHLSKSSKEVAPTIVKAANKLSSGIIAMASQTGSIKSSLRGSVSRQVMRTARSPVDRKSVV